MLTTSPTSEIVLASSAARSTTAAVEDHDGGRHQSRDVDGQERPPARPSRRRQPVDQEDEECGKGRQQVVRHDVLAEKAVGERRPIGDHEAVRGTPRVAVGERNAALDDRREEKPGDGRLQYWERHRAEKRPCEATRNTTVREREENVKHEKKNDRTGQHTDAAEKRLGRSLKRERGHGDRQRQQEETESIARASNQPVERRAEPSQDPHGHAEAPRNRIDEVVARRHEKARADSDEKAGGREATSKPRRTELIAVAGTVAAPLGPAEIVDTASPSDCEAAAAFYLATISAACLCGAAGTNQIDTLWQP